MAFTHKILFCYSILLLLLAVLARSNKSAPDLDHIDARVSPPRHNDTPPPPIICINDAHEPRPSNDDYDQLTFPSAKYHIDNESPPSKLIIDTPVSPLRHNDTHDSTALPDHDGNDGYEGMLPNNYKVTGAESVDNCYGPCSQIPYPSDCLTLCVEKGYKNGFCKCGRVSPFRPWCCCFGK